MEFMQLRYFQTVAREESFTRAAEALHISQSALSKSIARLEEELGFPLFARERNRIHLNRCGAFFLERAAQTLSELDRGVKTARDMAGLERGEAHIGVAPDVFIKHVVRDFLTEHPQASVYCYLLSREEMAEGLRKGSLDFAVSTERPAGERIGWEPLYEDRMEVLLSAKHPLAGSGELSLSALRDCRFVVCNVGRGVADPVYTLCAQAGFAPDILYEGYDSDTPIAFLESRQAVMLTPHSVEVGVRENITPPEGGSGLVAVPLRCDLPGVRHTIGAATGTGRFISAAAAELLGRVRDFYKSLGA